MTSKAQAKRMLLFTQTPGAVEGGVLRATGLN